MTGVLAYLLPHWRHLQLLFSLPLVVLVAAYWYIPESARWLLARGRRDEAELIIRNIAAVNGRQLPASFRLVPPEQPVKKSELSLETVSRLVLQTINW